MLLASNLINVENVYLNFVSIRILLPSGSRSTIFLLFRISRLRTLLRYFFGFLQIISFQHNQIILITLLRDDLDESCLFDSSFFPRRNKKNLCWYFSQFTSIVAKKVVAIEVYGCYYQLIMQTCGEHWLSWVCFGKLFFGFDLKLFWLKKGRNEIDKNMSKVVRRNW